MSKTAILSDQMYFVTLTIVEWIDLFTRQLYFDVIVENLIYCQQNKGLEIFEYVIMTNHLHLICLSRSGPLSNTLRDFKTYTSKQIILTIKENEKESRKRWILDMFNIAGKQNPLNKNYQIWQNYNWPTVIDSDYLYDQKALYIHNNPVKVGFVDYAEHYYYSSANDSGPIELDIA
jgi:putative transposase